MGAMISKKKLYPFNAEQTVNILSEFGPLVMMFIVNALYGINAGTWALILSTAAAIIAMRLVLKRLPVFPLIASSVTVLFGTLTLITKDPMWVQIKVTIFNAMFALFLFGSLKLGRNFFKYVFEKTFHYSKEGWDRFTWSFAWFFVFTAVLNEVVRLTFREAEVYSILGHEMTGISIWILFKVGIIMPVSAFYAWFLTRLMQKYRIPEPAGAVPATATVRTERRTSGAEYAAAPARASAPERR